MVELFDRGFGYMFGNSLWCVLLVSFVGVVVIFVWIEGVVYEFFTIKGVMEDVIDIVFNLKGIVCCMHLDAMEVEVLLVVIGLGEIIVCDIDLLSGVEIFNLDVYIVTFDKKTKLEFYLMIGCGCGYCLVEENKLFDQLIGVILIDLIFLLVCCVVYSVE